MYLVIILFRLEMFFGQYCEEKEVEVHIYELKDHEDV